MVLTFFFSPRPAGSEPSSRRHFPYHNTILCFPGFNPGFKENNVQSGYIATCVGSLHKVTMRMAGAQPDKQDIRTLGGHFEIVSLVGTVSVSGTHLHISVSDEDGNVVGGHLKEGSIVTTTAEVVVGYDENMKFDRAIDEATGFEELSVS